MLTFKEYLSETQSSYPFWAKAGALLLMSRIRSLTNQIKNKRDSSKKLDLIAQQNGLIASLGALGIAVNTGDKNIAGLQSR